MSTANSAVTRPGRWRHDDDAVAEAGRLAHVVGDEQTVRPRSRTSASSSSCEHVAGHRVERPERLVHQQDVGVLGERPGQRDPLAHAARQLVRALVGEAVEVDRARAAPRPVPGARPSARRRAASAARRSGDGQPREQRRLLEHQRRAARRRRRVPAGRLVEPGDEVEERRLAAARGADQAHELARRDVEVDVVEGGRPASAPDAERPSSPPRSETAALERHRLAIGSRRRAPAHGSSPRSASTSLRRVRS